MPRAERRCYQANTPITAVGERQCLYDPMREHGTRRSTAKRGIGMDEFTDVTDWREPDVPCYETSGPFDDYEGF